MSRAARAIVRLAAGLLPAEHHAWGRAMEAEIVAIEGAGPAFGFALGCLAAALRTAAHVHILRLSGGDKGENEMAGDKGGLLRHPRRVAGLCALAATGLGLFYMAMAGAPARYLAVNGTALVLGFLAVAVLGRVGDVRRGIVDLMLAGALLLTALFGLSAGGVTRWLSVGGILLQPGFFLLPILALRFAGSRDGLSAVAVSLAALALALQPDRALAGALAAGMAALAVAQPERNVFIALAAAAAGLMATLLRGDPSDAVPYVDQVFASSFAVHPLAGLAVWAGAGLLLLPALVGLARAGEDRALHGVFGALWFAVIVAAMLGNYPAPLVGYGASAIFGYLFSLLGLPARGQSEAVAPARDTDAAATEESPPALLVRPA